MKTPLSPEELVTIRRDLHENPELSHDEERTARVVAERLESLGLQPRGGVAGHGVVADIVGSSPGPVLLYRADMDALPIQEIAEREYGSRNVGVMHACGHDVHTTIGLGVAASLVARRDEIHGTVRMVFQPAEEAAPPPGEVIGAELMVSEGVLESPSVDAVFALHVMPTIPVGTIAGTGGPVWAASDLFEIVVRGRMAHGAYPHDGIDPILASAQIVQALQQIVSRNVDAREAAVLSVCRIAGGSSHNTIPDQVVMHGLLRTLNADVRTLAMRRMHEITSLTGQAAGCEAELRFVRGTWLTENDPAIERFALDAIREAVPELDVTVAPPQLGAEDFAAFSRRRPGCYLFLGVRNEERGITSMIHTPSFDVDERCLPLGVDAMVASLLKAGAGWAELSGTLSEPRAAREAAQEPTSSR